MLPVPRDEKAHIVFGADLRKDTPVGENVVVVGGGLIGSEEAVALAREGHKVTILRCGRPGPRLRPGCTAQPAPPDRDRAQHHRGHRPRCTGHPGRLCHRRRPGRQSGVLPRDTVVMAAGMRPDQDEVDRLMALVPESYVVGDAFQGPADRARPPGTRSTPWWTWGCDCDR